jgi:hypothetical protein
MASLNEIVYNVRNLPYGGFTSDDTNVTDDQIEFIVNYLRAKMFREAVETRHKRGWEPFVQDLGSVPFSLVDKSECVEITTDCDILRSTTAIPIPLDVNNSAAITAVQAVDGSYSFSKTYLAASKWQRFNKWTPRVSKWYYKNGYVYVTENEEIEALNLRGVFEKPRSAGAYKNCDGKPCWTPDTEYPIAGWMLKDITDTILRGEAVVMMMGRADDKNDGQDTKRSENGEKGKG